MQVVEIEGHQTNMVEAKDRARLELLDVPNVERVFYYINEYKLRHVFIDFNLNITVVFKDKGKGKHENENVKEKIEFIPGLSRIREILQRNDLTNVSIGKRKEIIFRRMTRYRPSKFFAKKSCNDKNIDAQ